MKIGAALAAVIVVAVGAFFVLGRGSSASIADACKSVETAIKGGQDSMGGLLAGAMSMEEGNPESEYKFMKETMKPTLDDGIIPMYDAMGDLFQAVADDSSAPSATREEARKAVSDLRAVSVKLKDASDKIGAASAPSDLDMSLMDDLDKDMSVLENADYSAVSEWIDKNPTCQAIGENL